MGELGLCIGSVSLNFLTAERDYRHDFQARYDTATDGSKTYVTDVCTRCGVVACSRTITRTGTPEHPSVLPSRP